MSLAPHAAPFQHEGDPTSSRGRTGFLLSHGFTGSPVSMRPWADHLAAAGYAVSLPLLPGHGTTWQQMNGTTWDDWRGALETELTALAARVDTVVVAGLSMGGGLALRLAADHPDVVAGLVLVNPAVNSTRFDVRLLPLLQHVVRSVPGIADDIKKPGVQEHGYKRTPVRAAASMFAGYKGLRRDLARVTCPVLLFHSAEDHVVDPSSSRMIMKGVSSTDTRLETLHESYHVATLDNDAPTIFEASTVFADRVASTRAQG